MKVSKVAQISEGYQTKVDEIRQSLSESGEGKMERLRGKLREEREHYGVTE